MRSGFLAVLILTFLQISLSAQTPGIVINSITPNQSAYCTGDTIIINFTTVNFSGNNTFTARMSKSGFTADSTSMGSISFSGNQTVTISYRLQTTDADAIAGYQIRIRSGNTTSLLFPVSPFFVNARPVAVASITSQTVCSGVFFNGISFSTSNNILNSTYTWSRDNTTNVSGTISGTGDISANFLVNNTLVNQTVTYTVIPTGPTPTTCIGSPITTTIIVKPAPTITVVQADTVCSGSTLNISFTANIPSTFFWYADDNANTTGEDLVPHIGSPIRDTITNHTSLDQFVTYNVVANSTTGNCQGAQEIIYVTVSPSPIITNDTTASICSGTLLSIPIISTIQASYTWKAAANASVTGESTTTQTSDTLSNTLVNTTASMQTVVYTITASADSGSCAANPHLLSVKVFPKPAATFTIANPTSQCERVNSFRFTGTANAAVTNYNWTFGSPLFPSSDTGSLVIKNFTGTGDSIPITLVTLTANGCPDSPQQFINIYPEPDAAFTFSDTTPCSSDTVSFVHVDTTNANSLIWVWGDGTTNTTCTSCTVGKHKYSSTSFPSLRTMQLVAVSSRGCRDTSSTIINVKPNPDANFGVNDNTQCFSFGNNQFVFTDLSTIADSLNNLLSYTWDFDDGSSSQTTKDANYTYAFADSYFVYHTLVTPSGCRDSVAKLMIVYTDPYSTIKNSNNTDTLCGGTTITLTADSGYTYLWSTTQTTRNITVRDSILSNPYIVNYSVTVTDNHLCTFMALKPITINPAPASSQILFDTSHTYCAGAKAQLFQIANPVNATYIWNTIPEVVSPNSYSGSQFNIDLPNSPGDTFSINVHATDNVTGCSNNDTITIYLSQNQAPVARIVRDLQTLICTNNTLSNYQWGYDDANLQEHNLTGETLQSYFVGADPDVAVSGKYYWVKIIDEGGCQSKIYYQSPPSYFTGITSINNENVVLRIYPNPTQSLFKIEIQDYTTAKMTIEVWNVTGQIIFKSIYTNEMIIDAGPWNSGMYLLKIISEAGVYKTQRLIKMEG